MYAAVSPSDLFSQAWFMTIPPRHTNQNGIDQQVRLRDGIVCQSEGQTPCKLGSLEAGQHASVRCIGLMVSVHSSALINKCIKFRC